MAQYDQPTSVVEDRLEDSDLREDTLDKIISLLDPDGDGDTSIQDYDPDQEDYAGTDILNVGPGQTLTSDPGTGIIILHPDAEVDLTIFDNIGQDRVIVLGSGDDYISVGDNSPAVSDKNMIVSYRMEQSSQQATGDDNIIIETGGGNDTVVTGGGNDTVTITGTGDNSVSTGEGDDTINMTGSGNDTVDTGDGNNTVIITGSGDGSVSTGDGNDTITVTGSGTYTIDTGDGEDTLIVETDQGEYTIIDPDGPDLLTPSGNDLLTSVIETELGARGDEVNDLIINTLSARLNQMIEAGTYSKLSAGIAMSAFSTVINDATEIEDLTDAVEQTNNNLFAEAADQYTIEDHGFSFKEVPLMGIDGTQYIISVDTSQ